MADSIRSKIQELENEVHMSLHSKLPVVCQLMPLASPYKHTPVANTTHRHHHAEGERAVEQGVDLVLSVLPGAPDLL